MGISGTASRGLCLACSLAVFSVASVASGSATVRAEAPTAAQDRPVEETYRRQCRACHGDSGRGDGRIGRRFDPPPADFQDPDGVGKMSDEEIAEIITDGRTSMPEFADVLSAEEITAMVAYVRELSRAPDR